MLIDEPIYFMKGSPFCDLEVVSISSKAMTRAISMSHEEELSGEYFGNWFLGLSSR